MTRCELVTFVTNTALITDMVFHSDRVVGQIIMASKDLIDALQSIDSSSKEVTISFVDSAKVISRHQRRNSEGLLNQTSRGASSIILSTADAAADSEDDELQRAREDSEGETVQMLKLISEGDTGSTEVSLHSYFVKE
jgi:hypothetical protein